MIYSGMHPDGKAESVLRTELNQYFTLLQKTPTAPSNLKANQVFLTQDQQKRFALVALEVVKESKSSPFCQEYHILGGKK